jgi:SprT protein
MNLFGFLKKKPVPKPQVNFEEKFTKILHNKIPALAIPYVIELWKRNSFSFTMPKTRKSCLGNYRLQNGRHTVSVNADLNTYSFLITLIHEIAHQHVAVNRSMFRTEPDPHGKEWKNTFIRLLQPLLEMPNVFPEDILKVLIPHMRNPAASSMRDPKLVVALKKYDANQLENGELLGKVASGVSFVYNQKTFRKIENRRTRTLVEDIKTKKRYTIPTFAEVSVL